MPCDDDSCIYRSPCHYWKAARTAAMRRRRVAGERGRFCRFPEFLSFLPGKEEKKSNMFVHIMYCFLCSSHNTYRVFIKYCVFSQFTATPPSRLHRFKALNAMQVYSHSYWLVIFCTTNSSRVLARERWQTYENSWKKTQYLMNTLYHLSEILKFAFSNWFKYFSQGFQKDLVLST